MIIFFDRGWFRKELYKASSPDEFLNLIEELHNQIRALYDNTDFKALSNGEKTKVLDQFKTAINVSWERIKEITSREFLTCSEEEKVYYAKKNNKFKIEKKKVEAFYNKDEFLLLLDKANESKADYYDIIKYQLSLLNEVIKGDDYLNLHVLEQRKVKDMYMSSIVLCWKNYMNLMLEENPLMSEYTKAVKKKEHVINRRERHRQKGIRKATFKSTKKDLIEEMLRLSDEEFERVQNELEKEYRQLRGLPLVPEV